MRDGGNRNITPKVTGEAGCSVLTNPSSRFRGRDRLLDRLDGTLLLTSKDFHTLPYLLKVPTLLNDTSIDHCTSPSSFCIHRLQLVCLARSWYSVLRSFSDTFQVPARLERGGTVGTCKWIASSSQLPTLPLDESSVTSLPFI